MYLEPSTQGIFLLTVIFTWKHTTVENETICSESPDGWGNAISAMAFNSEHSRLLVGNACGHILEYDMKDGKLVRTLNDVHPPEAAILHLQVLIFLL